ncbi:helix-turn-helix transcriptional regulator [Roseimaritima ulvae]|nr:HTH domain-containing protein [Roseimaritima ulvae]
MPTRLERILRILLLLQTRVPYNAFQLAEEMSVHRRTIFRDIAALRGLGIPIDFDVDTACYCLASRSALHLDRVSVEELSNLLITACLATEQHSDRAEATRRVALKLAVQLPEPLRQEIAKLAMRPGLNGQDSVSHDAGGNGQGPALPALPAITRAIETGQRIDVRVQELSGEYHSRQVSPARLTYCQRGWILQGTDEEGATVRYQVEGFPLVKPIHEY